MTWLLELIGFFGSLIPRYHHHECMDMAVVITRGKRIKVIEPGLTFYWPVWSSLYTRPAVTQTLDLPPKALTTADLQAVVASGIVRYRLDNAKTALVETHDIDSAILDEATAALCQFIAEHKVGGIQNSRQEVNTILTRAVRSELRRYGVYVERAQLTDFSLCLPLMHVGMNLIERAEDD